jgi:hypothetical protein
MVFDFDDVELETPGPPEEEEALAVGAAVVLHGLSATRHNGRHGVIARWDGAKGRFVVHLCFSVLRCIPRFRVKVSAWR